MCYCSHCKFAHKRAYFITQYNSVIKLFLQHSYFYEKETPSYIFLIMSITSKPYRKRINGIARYKENIKEIEHNIPLSTKIFSTNRNKFVGMIFKSKL